MKIFSDIKSIKTFLDENRNKRIGLVPTMGALHQGHLSLIEKAKKTCDLVVVSIFVNKKQFNNSNDYLLYPKTLEQDIRAISKIADILFCPNDQEIYPQPVLTKITIASLADHLCGKTRPGHFEGVALIVAKLLNIIGPNQAFFGEKDFQQLQIIKKLTQDLSMPIEIIGCPIIREEDGLAMSSRNLRLNQKERALAPQIYQNLSWAKKQFIDQISKKQKLDIQEILSELSANFHQIGLDKIDYLEICDEENLQPISNCALLGKYRLFIAIYIGEIRLIDNIELY